MRLVKAYPLDRVATSTYLFNMEQVVQVYSCEGGDVAGYFICAETVDGDQHRISDFQHTEWTIEEIEEVLK